MIGDAEKKQNNGNKEGNVGEEQKAVSWMEKPLAVLDVETTGFDSEKDRVVEIAVARFERGEVVADISTLVNPGIPMPAEAGAVNKITDEMLVDCPAFAEAVGKVAVICSGAQMVAYNEEFDRGFVTAELRRAGIGLWYDPTRPWIDPLVWVREVDRYVKGSGRHKLEVTCKRHGVTIDGQAHRALADVVGAGRLLYHLASQIGVLRTVDELLELQVGLAHQQRVDFERWRARQRRV